MLEPKPPTSPGPETAALPQATSPQPVPEGADLDHPALYFNRELSEIDFNWRVLHQAADPRLPLVERLRFLAITASNVDEFFQKRVGGLKRQRAAKVTELSPDGRTPAQQLELVLAATRVFGRHMDRLWRRGLAPQLAEQGVRVVGYHQLRAAERAFVDDHFRRRLYPVLTPLAVDPSRPFPRISNLSLSLAVSLGDPETGARRFARLKVPSGEPRWIRLPGSRRVLPIEKLVAEHAASLFPGMRFGGAYAFRLIRNAYLEHHDEVADDLIEMISEALREQRFAEVVRLEVEARMPAHLRRFLIEQLDIGRDDVFASQTLLRLTDLRSLVDEPDPVQVFPRWTPQQPARLASAPSGHRDIFSVIRQGDLLVHHPYESYDATVLRLLREAAEDPDVIAIKQTLYRTSDQSQVIAALLRAAERGKQVSVLIEIQARFDEQANIYWGEMLEEAGVHVAYGVLNYKTHAKALLVIRKEAEGVRCYGHIGTGNYNEKTAQVYTDLSFITAREEIGADLINLFHYLTGYAPKQSYRTLLVAPGGIAKAIFDLIEAEIERHRSHGDGRIVIKVNGLDDVGIIQQLYRASQAGVACDLIVRGLCRLRPGLPGISENIRVISIIGRFLEHDRVYFFHAGGEEKVYMGSADLRRRNLHDRVEVLAPIVDPRLKARIVATLRLALHDDRLAWELDADGRYRQRQPAGEQARNVQEALMAEAVRGQGG